MNRNFLRVAIALSAPLALACGSSSTVTVTPIAAGTRVPQRRLRHQRQQRRPLDRLQRRRRQHRPHRTCRRLGELGQRRRDRSHRPQRRGRLTTLIQTTTLPPGDPNCPAGGEEIDSGLDNGANGGTANDGILQPGEVTETSYVCNTGGPNVGSITPPGGNAGSATIHALGAASDGGSASSGGSIDVSINKGTLGGHVKLFQTGQADPTFTFPTLPDLDPGAVPVNVTGNATVIPYDAILPDAGAGTLVLNSNGYLSVLTADGGTNQATSLTIGEGVTLTVAADVSNGNANLSVAGACLNSGTITIEPGAVDDSNTPAPLSIACNQYWGAGSSAILNNGADGGTEQPDTTVAIGPGQSAGSITLNAGVIWNQGLVQANGGNGGSGGAGGAVTFSWGNDSSGSPLYNTGAIQSRGGTGSSGSGGNGNTIDIQNEGDINNSGPIDASGGAGTSAGGSGGSIDIYAGDDGEAGSLHNTGTLTSTGGSVGSGCTNTDSDAPCPAGSGGSIYVSTASGTLVSNAVITSTGGSSVVGNGGSGGGIEIVNSGCADAYFADGNTIASGDTVLSGSIDSSGGAGATAGGGAGSINITLTPMNNPNGQEIILYGYSSIDASGGTGQSAGSGGSLTLSNTYFYSNEDESVRRSDLTLINGYGPGGSVINYVPFTANGGAALGSENGGGSGGTFNQYTQDSYYFAGDTYEQAINAAPVVVNGGQGSSGGGGGWVNIYGLTGATNSGNLTGLGGTGLSAAGGSGDYLELTSGSGTANNAATLNGTGGSGVTGGGNGAAIYVEGFNATDSGDLIAAGGAGTGANANGGAGNEVYIQTTGSGGASVVTVAAPGGINVAGGAAGAGGQAGGEGYVQIDTWNVTSSWTH